MLGSPLDVWESAILSREIVILLRMRETCVIEKSGICTNASSKAATQNRCTCVNSESKASTATMSKCTLVDLCTKRSGSECSQKKKTPIPSTAPTRTTAMTASRMSGEPGGVMKGGTCTAAALCLVEATISGAGADDPSPFSSNVSTTSSPVINPALIHTRRDGKRRAKLSSRCVARSTPVFEGISCICRAFASFAVRTSQLRADSQSAGGTPRWALGARLPKRWRLYSQIVNCRAINSLWRDGGQDYQGKHLRSVCSARARRARPFSEPTGLDHGPRGRLRPWWGRASLAGRPAANGVVQPTSQAAALPDWRPWPYDTAPPRGHR